MTERLIVPQLGSMKVSLLKIGIRSFVHRWLAWFNLGWGLVFGLPWLTPLLMVRGKEKAARVIYTIYSFLCHQFADRSFFLFGQQGMYSSDQLLPVVSQDNLWLAMRAFIGTPTFGYKVAWSDRMVAIYGGIFLGGLIFTFLRKRLTSIKWWLLVLLLVPIAIDGTTHVLSDFAGFNVGFRYTNVWLAQLTQFRLGDAFYIGNGLGSFNSYTRLISGTLTGFALVWGSYPILEDYFTSVEKTLVNQMQIRKPTEQRAT